MAESGLWYPAGNREEPKGSRGFKSRPLRHMEDIRKIVDVGKLKDGMREALNGFVAEAAEDGDPDRVRELEGIEVTLFDACGKKVFSVKPDPFGART